MEDERLEKYLKDELTESERNQFEEDLEKDPELAEALRLQKDLLLGIKMHFDDRLKEEFKKIDLESEKTGDAGKTQMRTLWKWAASAAVGLTLVGVFYFMNAQDRNQRLFTAYYSDFPNIIERTQRDTESPMEQAFVYFQNEEWQEASEAFAAMQAEQPTIFYPQFYQALSLLNLDRASDAVPLFEAVLQSTDTRFTDPARWYLSLAYLKMDNEDQAIATLESIDENSPYASDAKELLDKLH